MDQLLHIVSDKIPGFLSCALDDDDADDDDVVRYDVGVDGYLLIWRVAAP